MDQRSKREKRMKQKSMGAKGWGGTKQAVVKGS